MYSKQSFILDYKNSNTDNIIKNYLKDNKLQEVDSIILFHFYGMNEIVEACTNYFLHKLEIVKLYNKENQLINLY